jgi:hypothetical protein
MNTFKTEFEEGDLEESEKHTERENTMRREKELRE